MEVLAHLPPVREDRVGFEFFQILVVHPVPRDVYILVVVDGAQFEQFILQVIVGDEVLGRDKRGSSAFLWLLFRLDPHS